MIGKIVLEDIWFGTSPLVVQFLTLYSICYQQGIVIAKVIEGGTIKLTFRRTFSPGWN
jgi:hypothetical protein